MILGFVLKFVIRCRRIEEYFFWKIYVLIEMFRYFVFFFIINDIWIYIGFFINIFWEGMVYLVYDKIKMWNFMISLVGIMYKVVMLE